VVTGANTGIGKETAYFIARKGIHVVLACRSKERGQEAVESITSEIEKERAKKTKSKEQSATDDVSLDVMTVELGDFASVRQFAEAFKQKYQRLDILVLNAGLVSKEYKENQDGLEIMFAVNHLGHFLLANLLLDTLRASAPSRVVVVASDAYHFAGPLTMEQLTNPLHYSVKNCMQAYGRSKLCNILFASELHRRLNGEGEEASSGVTVNSIHPGAVNSDLGRDAPWYLNWIVKPMSYVFMKSTRDGAKTQTFVALNEDIEGVSGKYFVSERVAKPKAFALDPDAARELWELSEQLTGLAEKKETKEVEAKEETDSDKDKSEDEEEAKKEKKPQKKKNKKKKETA